MYKMLALDMDGTLLDDEQKISLNNKLAIKKAIEKGIHIVLASGRHYKGLIPYLKELKLYNENSYSVTCSGAIIMKNGVNVIIYEKHIDTEDLKLMHRTCEKLDIDMCAYSKDGLLIHHENLLSRYDSVANNTELSKVNFENLDEDINVVKLNIINESNEIASEIIEYFPTIKIDNYTIRDKKKFNKNLLNELWRFPKEIVDKYNIVKPLPFFVEIFNKNINKAVGIKIIADRLGINMNEVIAMGDSGNDVHMLEAAGLGIAMANGSYEAKEAADELTLRNGEDGVAHIINKYFV